MYVAVQDEQESDFQPPRVYKMMSSADIWSCMCVLIEMLTTLTPWNNKINNDSSQFSMMFVVSAPIILFIYLLACEFICIEKRMALKCTFYNILAHCSVLEVNSVMVSLDSVASYHYACCYCVPVGWFVPGRGYGDRSGPMRGDTCLMSRCSTLLSWRNFTPNSS